MASKHLLQLTLFIVLFIISKSSIGQTLSEAMDDYDNMQYDIALKTFKKVWKKNKTDNEINYMYGKCILRAETDRTKAVPYLETVIGNDINYKDANFELAKAYTYKQEFTKARKLLDYFLKNYNFSDEDEDKNELTDKNKKIEAETILKQISVAERLLKSPLNVTFINLGKNVNTKRSEYNPFITRDGQTLYYTSNKKYDSDIMELINNGYFSVFTPDEEETWSKMKSLGKDVNSSENEIIVGLSKDEKKIIMNVNWMKDKGDIFITSKEKRKFKELDELEKTVNTKFNEASASMSINNDTLYFCSNKPGGLGGQDIYMSIQLPDGAWGSPINLGAEVNTKFDETYPVINYEGNQIQFASNRPESMGGFDIFTSDKDNGKWGAAKNMGYPINNFYDNYLITYSKSKHYAYVSQVREGGFGGLDIYQVIFNDTPIKNVIYTGTIKNANKELITSHIKIEAFHLKNNKLFAKSKYNAKGKYTFAFPPGQYKIKITGSSFSPFEKIVRIPENEINKQLIVKNIIVQ